MKQMNKASRGWKLLFMLPLAGLLMMTAISAPAQAERLSSVTPNSVSSGATVTVHGQFQTRYIRDRRYRYHLSLYPRRGGSATYLTITRSSATALTATVPSRVAPGSYVLMVDMQPPGGGFGGLPQMSNKIPVTITRAITIRPVRPAQRVVGTIDIPPVISSITPQMLTSGDRLLIKGRGFGRRQQAGGRKNTILFSRPGGWVTIPVQSWSDTMIMTRPINQKPAGGGVVKLHFYRNNREVLTKRAFSEFHNPRILGYQPTKVRPGDLVTVNVRDIPPDFLLGTRFGATLMRGNRPLARIDRVIRRSDSKLELRLPRNVEGDRLSIALYRKSDSKIVSNLLPGLDISSHNWAPLRVAGLPSLCSRQLTVSFSGGPFMRNGRPLAITATFQSDDGYGAVAALKGQQVLNVISTTRIETRLSECVLLKNGIRIQFSYPDGSKSNWVPIQLRP